MVKSNSDDLGVAGLLETWATTFILGVWGHVVEEVVENLGFTMEIYKNPVPLRGQKCKEMTLEKFCSDAFLRSALKIIYNIHALFYAWSWVKSRGTRYFFLALNKCWTLQ